ncbi:MAG: DUF1993 domain-containing protein [bacterium]
MNYAAMFARFAEHLTNLSADLDKAVAYAAEKKFDPAVLLNARLAPDQFNLMRQIQVACDNAKNGAARLADRSVPAHADNEATVAELQTRLKAVVELLGSFDEAAFAGADERVIALPYWGGRYMTGADYLVDYLVPNFYFHVTTAYSILRHNGVNLGKLDFLGRLPLRLPATQG